MPKLELLTDLDRKKSKISSQDRTGISNCDPGTCQPDFLCDPYDMCRPDHVCHPENIFPKSVEQIDEKEGLA